MKFHHRRITRTIVLSMLSMTLLTLGSFYAYLYMKSDKEASRIAADLRTSEKVLGDTKKELDTLKAQDQVVVNKKLEADIATLERTYDLSVVLYEDILRFRDIGGKTPEFEKQYAQVLVMLSKRNYASAEASLRAMRPKIVEERNKLAAAAQAAIPANVPQKNEAPGAGYSRQSVATDFGTFMVDIVAADLGSTRVIVDTASDGTCKDNCPVASLGTYAGRSGAFAGVNGPYFCPASYPSCAGKSNSFDTLIMNKNKVYFNSDNNVHSSVPAVIFSGGSARYTSSSGALGQGGSDSVIAAQPMLLSGGNVVFGGDDEAKRAGAGSRSFIGSRGSTVYIGVVHNANVAQVARVLKAMGLEYALNLDSGGSTALMSGGRYVVGPGRDTPFGILFVRK